MAPVPPRFPKHFPLSRVGWLSWSCSLAMRALPALGTEEWDSPGFPGVHFPGVGKGFANKISFSSPASLFRGLVCSTNPENLGLGVLQDGNPAHGGMPGSTSQAIAAW